MQHSKILLAGTACLLAVAGIAATKAHRFATKVAGYYRIGAGPNAACNNLAQQKGFTVNSRFDASTNTLKTTIGTAIYTVYSQLNNTPGQPCGVNKLYVDGIPG